jgi:hypothetical protein
MAILRIHFSCEEWWVVLVLAIFVCSPLTTAETKIEKKRKFDEENV